jgi:hypothetical protein
MAIIRTLTLTKPEGTSWWRDLNPEKAQQMSDWVTETHTSCLSNTYKIDENNPNIMYSELVFASPAALERYKTDISTHPLWLERKAYWEENGFTKTFTKKVI